MIKRQNTTLERGLRAMGGAVATLCLTLAHLGFINAQGLDEPLRALRL